MKKGNLQKVGDLLCQNIRNVSGAMRKTIASDAKNATGGAELMEKHYRNAENKEVVFNDSDACSACQHKRERALQLLVYLCIDGKAKQPKTIQLNACHGVVTEDDDLLLSNNKNVSF